MNELAIAGMAEVELGKMAAERSTNAEVKKFGQMMVDDHTAAGDKLKAVASQHNIPVPTALDDKHRDLRDKLAKLQGADFDREYMNAMVEGHEAVASKLESRIDKEDLAKWKTETSRSDDRPESRGPRQGDGGDSRAERQPGDDGDQPVGGRGLSHGPGAPHGGEGHRQRAEETHDELTDRE